jgi:hypothetical protein
MARRHAQSGRALTQETRRLCARRWWHQQTVESVALTNPPASLVSQEGALTGRTLPPFSQRIAYERRRWAPFKRALPKEDHAIFDRLFDGAKLHIQAGVMLSRPWPFETIVMAILLEQQKQLERLERLLDALHGRGQP